MTVPIYCVGMPVRHPEAGIGVVEHITDCLVTVRYLDSLAVPAQFSLQMFQICHSPVWVSR